MKASLFTSRSKADYHLDFRVQLWLSFPFHYLFVTQLDNAHSYESIHVQQEFTNRIAIVASTECTNIEASPLSPKSSGSRPFQIRDGSKQPSKLSAELTDSGDSEHA